MKIDRMLDEYIENSRIMKKEPTYKYERTCSRSLKRCFSHLGLYSVKQLLKSNFDNIVSYYKESTECANVSINHNLGVLKRALKYHGCEESVLKRVPRIKASKKHFMIFKETELVEIFRYVSQINQGKNSLLYKAVVYMLLDTGARINELLNIKISNINFDERNIYLEVTKNGKPRHVMMTHLSRDIVRELINHNRNENDYLFYNKLKGRNLNYNDVKLFFRRMKDKLNLQRCHAHMFRRSFATKLHESGASLISIQLLLGHESIEMTRNYIDVSMSRIKKDYDTHFKNVII